MPNLLKARSWIPGISFARELGGDFPIIGWYANSSAGALVRGQFVTLQSGYLQAATIGATFTLGVTLAAAAASAAAVPIALAHPNNMFVGQATTAITVTGLPMGCDFTLGPPNKVNLAGTTVKVLRVVEVVGGDDVADTVNSARVLFFIQASQYDVRGTDA